MVGYRQFVSDGLLILFLSALGCSDQDAASVRKVSLKTWDRAASFADDTREKLKAGIQPLPKPSTPTSTSAPESRDTYER